MRAAARNEGVAVELTSIDDPNPVQDKYLSPTGRALPPALKTAAWRVQRKRETGWRSLPPIHWCGVRRQSGWDWISLPVELMDDDFCQWLIAAVERLPQDVEQVEEASFNISVYWHETTEGTESDVFEFLNQCRDRQLYKSVDDD